MEEQPEVARYRLERTTDGLYGHALRHLIRIRESTESQWMVFIIIIYGPQALLPNIVP